MKWFFTLLLVSNFGVFSFEQSLFQDEQVLTGYYTSGWEYSTFYTLTNEKEVYGPAWLSLDESLDAEAKLLFSGTTSALIQIKGSINTDGHFGHLGAYDSEITVKKLLKIDTSRTLQRHFENKENE